MSISAALQLVCGVSAASLATAGCGAAHERVCSDAVTEGRYQINYERFSNDCLSSEELELPETLPFTSGNIAFKQQFLDRLVSGQGWVDGCTGIVEADVEYNAGALIRISGALTLGADHRLRGTVEFHVSHRPNTASCDATASVVMVPIENDLSDAGPLRK